MHPIYSILMLGSSFCYVALAVMNNMDGIYENYIFTWIEQIMCVFFLLGWVLEFYIAPSTTSFLKSKLAILSLLVFVPVLAIPQPD